MKNHYLVSGPTEPAIDYVILVNEYLTLTAVN